MEVGVIILAAGASARMGRPKLLLPWDDTSVLGHLIRQWQRLGAAQTTVVCACGDAALKAELDHLEFPTSERIANPLPGRGMFGSIRCAAAWKGWHSRLSHWVIVLGDQPHLPADPLKRLLEFSATRADAICQPAFKGRPMHPVVLPAEVFHELASATEPNLKVFLQNRSGRRSFLDVHDPGFDLDIDGPEDYAKARELGSQCSPGLLQVRNLTKSFPGVRALDGMRLDIEPGKVHALMGENGAGKSTLLRILAGLETPDAGEIIFNGSRIQDYGPHEALRLGLSMIHQELLPFPELTVAENIFMGQEPASRFLGWIRRRQLNLEARQWLDRLRAPLAPTTRMRELTVAEMQMVEIAKALSHRAKLIIMDEPTSALSDREIAALFAVIGDLKQQGVAVIYVSHKLEEVFRIADTVTVLRDGRYVATHPVASLDSPALIALMVGRELNPALAQSPAVQGDVALTVRGLTRKGRFHGIHFILRRGEILGLAGLMGAGRTDLVNALFGLAPAEAGEILVRGRPVRIASPRDAIRQGLALVSEDRRTYGLVLKMSVMHNLTLSSLRACCRGCFIDPSQEWRVAGEQLQAFSIKAADLRQSVNGLSGGNQQKIVIAKALLTNPDILILDEPTRGIDIGAKAEVYAIINRLAQAGKAILLVSSEWPEILSLSNRILVMREGQISAELDPRQTTPEEIVRWAMPG